MAKDSVKKVVKPRKQAVPGPVPVPAVPVVPVIEPAKQWVASLNVAELSTEELTTERTRLVLEKQALDYEMEPLPMYRVPKQELLRRQAARKVRKDRMLQLLADLSLVNIELKKRNVIQHGIQDQVKRRVLDITYAIFIEKNERAVPLVRAAISDLLGTGWSPRPLLDLPEPGNER